VTNVFAQMPLNVSFRRALAANKWAQWLNLLQRLMDVHLSNKQDVFVVKLTTSGSFSNTSMYVGILNDDTIYF
jgi:hypothetical protein